MTINGFEIVKLRNYILANEEIELFGPEKQNRASFGIDFHKGELVRYRGEYVAYYNGYRCGHRKEETGRILFDMATSTYGPKNTITIFRVPENGDLEASINNALRGEKV